MKTNDFNQSITSAQLKENLEKRFGTNVNLAKYNREQLEDIRNKFRTKIFQQEGSAGINDLLANETYQKDKAMLELLNTRIKEMLGEDIKKLRDKMDQLSEAKNKDRTGDGKKNFDDVQVARMTAGGVPKKKAIAKATSDNFKEAMSKKCCCSTKGEEKCPVHGMKEDSAKTTKTASGGTVTRTGTSTVHKAGPTGYGNKWDGETQDQAPAKPSKASKSSAEKKAEKSKDIKLPPWKGNVTRHSSNHGADKDDGTGDEVKESKECGSGHTKMTKGCKECAGMWESDFSKLEKKLSHQKGVTNPAGLAAKIGRDKYGKEEMAKKAAAGRKKASESAFKHNVRFVNESLEFLLAEDEEGKAKAITAAGDMVNDFTSWMQRVGQYQTKTMIELADAIKADFGAAEAETFKQSVGPALSATLEVLTQQREAVSSAVAVLAGEASPEAPMGMEPEMPMEPGMDMSEPDEMNPMPAGDEFGAADAAAGGSEISGREMRESKFARRLAESHSIMSKLAK